MNRNPAFSERFTEALRKSGYWNPKRKGLEIGRFCVENGYLPSYVYRWLRGEVPRAETLLALARQLHADPEWLVGMAPAETDPRPSRRPRPAPIAGGSDAGQASGIMFALARRFHSWWGWLPEWTPTPTLAYA